MSDTTKPMSAEEILKNDLGSVSMALPLLPKDTYRLTVKKVEQAKSKKGGDLIKINLALADDAVDTSGNTVNKGFPLFDQISLTPTENFSIDDINKRLKRFRFAVTGQEGGAFFPLNQYEGGTVKARVDIQPAKDGYEAKNTVMYELPKKLA